MTVTVGKVVADPQQTIAELRRQLDERTAERDGALQRETATAEVLQVINSSPGDLTPVFEAMLDRAMRLCEAAFGVLWTYDGEGFSAAALHDVPDAYAEFITSRRAIPPSGGRTGFSQLVSGSDFVQFDDVAVDYADLPSGSGGRALIELGGARTGMLVALRKEGTLVGSFVLYRQEVRPFTEKQIALSQNFAAQAVIAMENARLLTETREALEQQTATAEVLQVINSSPGDLAPVFDAILEKAMRLCEAAFGTMSVADRFVAFRGVPDAFAEFRRRNPVPPGQGGMAARIRAGEPFVHVIDVKDDDRYRSGEDPQRRAIVDLGGARTYLVVPLSKDKQLLGAIQVYRQEVRPFTDKQIALLQNFAAQAVIAMENARLITETREALEQQTATAEVLQVINSSPGDLTPVFDAMLDRALRLCEAAFGVLMTFDGGTYRLVAARNVPQAADAIFQRPLPIPPDSSIGRIVRGESLIQIADVSTLPPIGPGRRAIVEGGARSTVWVALRKNGAALGCFNIYRQEVRPFSDKQIALLQNFAAQAVIAIENARLLDELRARTDEIAGWNCELEARVATQLAEIERTGKLRRFLAPQLADLIVAQGDESILESHRREIVVVFCDLRGFTGFAERAEPEEVMALLRDYHAAMGPIVAQYEGTIDHYSGDGIMVFFNDPLPTPDPTRRAIDMAVAMRATAQDLLRTWRRHGHDLGFGVGISQGYATLGQIGFAERMDYTAIGTVTNLAARLCGEAKDGQILVSRRVAIAVEDSATLEEIGDLSLKGLSQAVAVYNVVR